MTTGQFVPTATTAVLRAKISDGKSVVVTAPTGGVAAGLFYLINNWFGAAFSTVIAGEKVALSIEQAEYECTQLAVVTFSAGDLVYWIAATSLLTNAATGNRLVGRCTQVGTGVVSFVLGSQTKN
ncbi:MAG: DUF2190 family protein [Alkaliphilus sp.]